MEAKGDHLAVVIGASRTAEELRRYLVTCGTPCSGVANHLRGLRRSLLLGRPEMAVVCVALNRLTLERHGEELRRLVRDLRAFPTPIHTIGLVPPLTLMSRVVHLGCDIYVSSAGEARDVLGLLRRHRRRDHVTARRKELLEMWAEGEAGCKRKTPAVPAGAARDWEDQGRPPTSSLSSLRAVPEGAAWIWRGSRRRSSDRLSLFSPRRAGRCGVDLARIEKKVLRQTLSLLSAPCRKVRRGLAGIASASPASLSLFSPRRAERCGVGFSREPDAGRIRAGRDRRHRTFSRLSLAGAFCS
jgi:hypothetical protein